MDCFKKTAGTHARESAREGTTRSGQGDLLRLQYSNLLTAVYGASLLVFHLPQRTNQLSPTCFPNKGRCTVHEQACGHQQYFRNTAQTIFRLFQKKT